MKSFHLSFILLCTGILSSCTKNAEAPKVNSKVLPGVWELRAMSGGQVPYDPNIFKPGNGSLWTFTETEFKRIYKDSVYESGSYSISHGTGTDLNTGRKIDQFIFNNEPGESFELGNDTLKFYYGAIPFDGGIEMYVKIAEGN